jgi:hypothetical protein
MNYSLDKTLKENVDDLEILNEQSNSNRNQPPRPETSKGNWEKDKREYQSKNPGMVWDPNVVNYPSVEFQTPEKNPGSDYFLSLQNAQANQLRQKLMTKGNWVKMSPKNVGLRGTPFGFHPSEYPEYLKKVAEINKKYPDEETTWYNPTTWFDNDTDDIRNQELEKLKKQYFHKEFPYGITQEDYQDWLKAKKTISDEQVREFSNIKKSNSGLYKSSKEMPGSDYFLDLHNQNMKKLELYQMMKSQQSFKNLGDYIDAIFEYDPVAYNEINKGWLDKFWENYGSAVELLAWLAVDFFSEGLATQVSAARQGELLAKLIRIAGRSGFPVGLGIAKTIKSGYLTEDAVIDFVFAILPWAHNYFGIAKTPSAEVVESIVAKRKGLNLRNLSDVKKYIKSLTEEEKYFFKKIAKLDKSQLDKGLKSSMKELDNLASKKGLKQVKKINKQSLSTTGKKIKPSTLKSVGNFLGKVVYIDLPAIEISKSIARKFGFLDKEDKVKALEQEFKNKQGKDLLILLANAIEVIKDYPGLSTNETIKKIRDTHTVSNENEALNVISQIMSELLVDENGDPFYQNKKQ